MKVWGRLAFAVNVVGLVLSLAGCEIKEGNDVALPVKLPLQTIFLGRYSLDVPAELNLRGEVELYYGLDKDFKTVKAEVLHRVGDEAEFESAVAMQTAELTGSFDASTPSKNMLAKQQRVDKDTVLILEHRDPTMMGYYRVLLIARVGRAVALFKADVFKEDKPEDIEAKVLAVVAHTRYAANAESAGKGTCIGPLVIDAGQDGERFTVGTRGTTHADLTLSFTINSLLAETDGGLLRRVDSKTGVLAKLGAVGSTLRRGNVTIAGRRAEELVQEDKEEGKKIRLFVAETLLTSPSTLSEPRVHVEMGLGGRVTTGEHQSIYVDPSLDKEESLAVWDAIIKSIRLRPGAV